MTRVVEFGQRLELALKALNISRGRLAAEARVDKSLVSRWLRGLSEPRGHNLEAVTAVIRETVPGFNQLSWTLPIDAFAQLVGGDAAADDGRADAAAALPGLPVTEADRQAVRLRAGAYEGFWRATHPSLTQPGEFRHQYARIRRGPGGLLHLRVVHGLLGWSGPLMAVNDQLYGLTRDEVDATFACFMFQGVVQPRAATLDGLVLVPSKSAARDLSACPYFMERIGDLAGDPRADDARLDDLRNAPLIAETLPPDLERHLARPADAGGVLRLSLAISRSIGLNMDPNAIAAAG
jgi:transcriptional regulator with XRE-family HTH domain